MQRNDSVAEKKSVVFDLKSLQSSIKISNKRDKTPPQDMNSTLNQSWLGKNAKNSLNEDSDEYSQSFYEKNSNIQEEDAESSDSDDKTQKNFWRKSQDYELLPDNVKKAILTGKMKAKHSEFYYKMRDLNTKI